MTFPSFNSTVVTGCPTAPAPFGGTGGSGSAVWAPNPLPTPRAGGKRQQPTGLRRALTKAEIAERIRQQQRATGMVPTMPADLERSVTSAGSRPPNYFNQMREDLQSVWKAVGQVVPTLAFPVRAFTAVFTEIARGIVEPQPISAEPPTTDPDHLNALLAADSRRSTAGMLGNAAAAFYQVMESEFGSGKVDLPNNATHQTVEQARFRAATTSASKSVEDVTSQIAVLPLATENRPCLMFDDLMERVQGEFILYGKPEDYRGQSLQGKVVVISPVSQWSLDRIRNLLRDVSRGDDILLTALTVPEFVDSRVHGIALDSSGLLSSSRVSPSDHSDCLGLHPSRCFTWDSTEMYPWEHELVSDMHQIAVETVGRDPWRTVFVVTDSFTAAAFTRRSRAAIRLEQRLEQREETAGE